MDNSSLAMSEVFEYINHQAMTLMRSGPVDGGRSVESANAQETRGESWWCQNECNHGLNIPPVVTQHVMSRLRVYFHVGADFQFSQCACEGDLLLICNN